LIFVPITTSLAGGGRTAVTLISFGAFFIQSKPNGSLLSGEFVYGVLPGSSGVTAPASGAVAYSLRLID
jgi:hypothetical protein